MTDPKASLGHSFGVYDNNIVCQVLNDASGSTQGIHDIILSSFHPPMDAIHDIARIHPNLRHPRLDIFRT
ncbi:hypothetical protein M405DRAFT_817911 [Rhizopogon salebrosus TDB-379]|nr:hypothetical protein M405DRAFT_817911 [Rhizopogon salebrosus TDB-379]